MSEEDRRQVLNAFVGMTNIIDEVKIDEIMISTFGTIMEILSDYCGPYGKFAILTNPSDPTAQPTFTKDGLNIVRAIEFISPMEKHVKDTMAYISQRIERESGDGTTSSLIMVAAIMKTLKSYLKDKRISYGEFTKAYSVFSSKMLDILEESKVTVSTQQEIYNVALAQAMSSSHGNKELSKCVAELYSETPKEAWNYVVFERERLETDKDITVKVDESDYSCKAHIFDNRFYNTAHGDAFELEDTDVILCLSQMVSNAAEFNKLVLTLKDYIANGKKVVIVAPDGADVKVRTTIEELIGIKGNKNIGIFNVNVFSPTINDHVGMLTTFGVKNLNAEDLAILNHANVSFKAGILSISKVLEKTEDMLHPDFHDEDSNVFKYLKDIDEFVEEYKKSTSVTHTTDTMVKDARRIYNTILLQKQGRIVIGGAAYDNQALLDVVQDTMKATRATLLEGASMGGYQLLRVCLDRVFEGLDCELQKSIVTAFKDGIVKLTECSCKYIPENEADVVLSMLNENKPMVYNVAIKCIRSLRDCLDSEKCEATVLQPISVDKGLIRRFGEVALKFMFTNRVIIPGGVIIDEKEGDTK